MTVGVNAAAAVVVAVKISKARAVAAEIRRDPLVAPAQDRVGIHQAQPAVQAQARIGIHPAQPAAQAPVGSDAPVTQTVAIR